MKDGKLDRLMSLLGVAGVLSLGEQMGEVTPRRARAKARGVNRSRALRESRNRMARESRKRNRRR